MLQKRTLCCLVCQADSVVLAVDVDKKDNGVDCLNKVCEKLGILETDYLGLQYRGCKDELLWLNLRNKIHRQVSGPEPFRFQLRVKFFVQPHLLLQETTRHQFYLNVKANLKEKVWNVTSFSHAVELAALMAQADLGDFNPSSAQHIQYGGYIPDYKDDTSFIESVARRHQELSGCSRENSQYEFLKEAALLERYGVEEYSVKKGSGEQLRMGVGPEGITLTDQRGRVVQRLAYPNIQVATHSGRCLFLTVLKDNGDKFEVGFKLVSRRLANGAYRCVTEMHSFYRCDTVRNSVFSQFSRDLKGTLASLFNENTSLGKNYVFDIQRTCREVYDNACRSLHPSHMVVKRVASDGAKSESSHLQRCCCNELRQQLFSIESELSCSICMDDVVKMVFVPCGHCLCCSKCASQLEHCPLCRAPIQRLQRAFLPRPPSCPTKSRSISLDSTGDEKLNDCELSADEASDDVFAADDD